MEDLSKIVEGENAQNIQDDSKQESTKPTVVKREKAENKKPLEPKAATPSPVVANEPLTAVIETVKEKKNDSKKAEKAEKAEKKHEPEVDKEPQIESVPTETQEAPKPDKKQTQKIKGIKKNAKKSEKKVDKLKEKVKKAKKKDVKKSKLKDLTKKLEKAYDKLKRSLKKVKKAKK